MHYPEGVRPHGRKLQIRWTDPVTGKRRAKTLNLSQSRGHIAQAARIRRQYLSGEMDDEDQASSVLFRDLAQIWLDQADVKTSTRNAYRDSINLYWAPLAEDPVRTITTKRLIQLDDALDWPGVKTRNNALIPLRQLFRFGVARGYLTENPAAALTARRNRRLDEPDPYTREERDQLLAWLERHAPFMAYVYYHLGFFTGMRTGELLAVTWADFTGTTLMVNKAYVRRELTTTKTDQGRRVVLLPETVVLLNGLPRPIHGGTIVVNQYGRSYESGYHLNKAFRRAHKATGVRHREGPYPWRHTYASTALTAGVRPGLVAAQLGHSLAMLYKHYGRWIPSGDDLNELSKMTEASDGHGQRRHDTP